MTRLTVEWKNEVAPNVMITASKILMQPAKALEHSLLSAEAENS